MAVLAKLDPYARPDQVVDTTAAHYAPTAGPADAEAERMKAMHWFGEWTGARDPYHGGDQGAIPPGFGCRDAGDAYDRYVGLLDVMFHPGRLGPPPRSLAAPDDTGSGSGLDQTRIG